MPPSGDSGGFLLSLVTESFAVRALLGSLAAALLAALLVGVGLVRTRRARRLILLTPVLSAAAAAIASIGEVYLPQLWVAAASGSATGSWLDLSGEQRGIVTDRGLDVLVVAYTAMVLGLVARRCLGFAKVRRTMRRAAPIDPDDPLAVECRRLAEAMGLAPPRLVLLASCPGGAFTTGVRRPLIAVDPALLSALDDQELEGLLAHELAHIARYDPLLGAVVGLFRDLSFFLPPLHAAARWVRREQEESADELASLHTGRPVALASSILKVWDATKDRQHLAGSCAAVAASATLPTGVFGGRALQGGATKVLTARVERLIARRPLPSRFRQRSELALASAVLIAGTTAALTVPTWIATDLDSEALSFLFLSASPATPVESPAFATFRSLTPAPEQIASVTEGTLRTHLSESGSRSGCPCVESQAQLLRGEPAVGALQATRLAWGNQEHPAWAMVRSYEDAVVRTARPVFALTDSGPQVGLFLVSRSTP